ncbi:MAG: cytochrome b/b6 domain-containing protein [Albidovulum sp.]
MQTVKVWDPFVRLFHWSLVIGVTANALLNDPEGQAHEVIGLSIAALLGARILWGFVGPRYARFASFKPSISASAGQMSEMATGRRHAHVGHSPLGGLMIYNLIVTLLVITGTGYMMTTVAFFGLKWVKELHEIAVTWVEISAAAHIAAVLFESRRLGINLPKSMLTGYKEMPAAKDQE